MFFRYEASPHIPEHYPFRVQTQLIHIILYTFSSCPYRHNSPLPKPHFYRLTPNNLHSYIPHSQTTSIYHASPPQPRSEPQKIVQIHTVLTILATPRTSISPLFVPSSPTLIIIQHKTFNHHLTGFPFFCGKSKLSQCLELLTVKSWKYSMIHPTCASHCIE